MDIHEPGLEQFLQKRECEEADRSNLNSHTTEEKNVK